MNLLLGQWSGVENLVYLLVGLSAVVLLVGHKGDCRACGSGAGSPGMGM